MDLPPDKAKLLKQYDNEKKWDIICDQVSILYIHCAHNILYCKQHCANAVYNKTMLYFMYINTHVIFQIYKYTFLLPRLIEDIKKNRPKD